MNARSALIVGAAPAAGGGAHYARLIAAADVLIAADGGLLLCLEAGRVPDICVGDFDSTPPEALERARVLGADVRRYPADKDVSDLDLAVSVARELGCAHVTLSAAFAGRLDHTLAAVGTLVAAADLAAHADEPGWVAWPLDASVTSVCELAEAEGTIVSVFAMGGPAVISAHGFAYPLESRALEPLSSNGLSNIVADEVQSVSVETGKALVVVNRRS